MARSVSSRISWREALLFAAVLIAVDAIFFRAQIANGFSVLFGNRYDAVIEAALLEHWFNTLRGLENWATPLYFFPYPKTLGYTDGFFLYGLISAVFRGAGLDPFAASEAVNIVLKSLGFVAFFIAAKRMLKLSFGWALFGAALFALSQNGFLQAGHAQIFAVAFVPLQALLLYETVRALRAEQKIPAALWGCAAAVFYAAWLMTAYYMAWFFALFACLFLAAWLCVARPPAIEIMRKHVMRDWLPLGLIILVLILSLIPFVTVYLPVAHATGGEDYDYALFYAPRLYDLISTGPTNLVFGRIYQAALPFVCPSCAGHMQRAPGFTPALAVVLIVACVSVLRKPDKKKPFLAALAATLIVTLLLCVAVGGVSGWFLVYHLFPGASGLRVISRYLVFLTAPAAALVAWYLSQRKIRWPLVVLCGFLLLEQINLADVTELNRDRELTRAGVAPPPARCAAFYVTAAPDSDATLIGGSYPHNVAAMMIVEVTHVPTLNGIATFNPPDWNFANPTAPDYAARLMRYSAAHNLSGLCRLDLKTGKWR